MGNPPATIIIARHGARLDAADKNWHLTSPTPYDPPLSWGGWLQSRALGARINTLLHSSTESRSTSSKSARDDQKLPSHPQASKRKRRIIVHSSPYLRCVQTAIAVSSAINQHCPETESVESAFNSKPNVTDGSSVGSATDPARDSFLSPVADNPPAHSHGNPHCLLRVDAFLGEWLCHDYFDQITPPPKSERLIAAAKAELLRREEGIVTGVDKVNKPSPGHFPGGWNGVFSAVFSGSDENGEMNLPPTSGTSHTQGPRNRAGSYDSISSTGTSQARRILSKINTDLPPIPDGAYIPPTPSYAISPSSAIPAGYVAHARDACVKIDYQWDSMREPQNWGNGGEYGEEWSTMHGRFRTGFERMLTWYRNTEQSVSPGRPRRHSQQRGSYADIHEPDNEDDLTETVLIVITHGAGCNALVGALTGAPVLLDFATASLTMAACKDAVDEASNPDITRGDVRLRRPSGAVPVLEDYSLTMVASTDHLRPGINSSRPASELSSPNTVPSPSIQSYRYRLTARPSLSQSQFMIGPSPNSVVGSKGWTFARPSTAPRGSVGLWGSLSARDDSSEEIIPDFGDSVSVSSDQPTTGQGNENAEGSGDESTWPKQLPHRTLSQHGLWGSSALNTDRDPVSKRRWTVTERRA